MQSEIGLRAGEAMGGGMPTPPVADEGGMEAQ